MSTVTFYLVYSDVASFASGYWDPQNFLITAPDIDGPVVRPGEAARARLRRVAVPRRRRHHLAAGMSADWRPGRDRFGGIEIQQYDRANRTLVGEARIIFTGTAAGLTEGPHLYRHDGWY